MKTVIIFLSISILFCNMSIAQKIYFSNICDKNASEQTAFKSNEFIFLHLRIESPFMSVLDLSNPNVTFHVEYSENGKVIEYEDLGLESANFKGIQTPGYIVLPIISNPDDNCVSYKKNLFATYTPKAFQGLSVGKHTIQCKVSCYNYKEGKVPFGTSSFTLDVAADAKNWYEKNYDLSYKAMMDRGLTFHLEKYASTMTSNNSGTSKNTVRVSFSSSADVRIKIYSGGGSSEDFMVQSNVTTTAYTVQVGSKIELLESSSPYSKIADLYTVGAEMDGKTLKLK